MDCGLIVTGGNFKHILEATDSPPAQPQQQAKCLQLGLCKETVKESSCDEEE